MQTILKYDSEYEVKKEVALLEYENNTIEYVLNNNYINATQMAKIHDKKMDKYLSSAEFAKDIFVEAVGQGLVSDTLFLGIDFLKLNRSQQLDIIKQNNYWGLVKIKKGGNSNEFQGTFIHRSLAIQFASWCNPFFKNWVARQIEHLLTYGKVVLEGTEAAQFHEWKEQTRLIENIPAIPYKETDLAFRIKNWVDLCVDGGRFYIEHPLINTVNQATKTRRLDFVKSNGRNVIAYELKLNKITPGDIATTIGTKGYYHLCKEKFAGASGRKVKFIFLSPSGITKEAELLLDKMTEDISFLSVHDFCYEYYIKGTQRKWRDNISYLNEQIKEKYFSHLFNPEFVYNVKEQCDYLSKRNKPILLAA